MARNPHRWELWVTCKGSEQPRLFGEQASDNQVLMDAVWLWEHLDVDEVIVKDPISKAVLVYFGKLAP